ncbi:MAG: NAD(P)-binding protein [Sphingomonadales bacterium]|nr:NAD(P)-binding protein [Sphingomonadales bacterium]
MIAEDLQSAIDLDKPAEKLANVPSDFSVVIIGAGVSGLLAASNLTRAGIRCTILEKLDNVGGSWYVNRYPGCGVDVPSHLWDIERLIRFNCDVQEARYLPDDQKGKSI